MCRAMCRIPMAYPCSPSWAWSKDSGTEHALRPLEGVMELINYVARRLALIIPTLLGASLVMFVLTMLIPGDPALMRLGNFATAEQLKSLREEMGLEKPPYERYGLYLGGLLRGDMGRS